MRKFIENYSLIRVLNAIPGTRPVDIYLDGALFFNRVLFTQFSPYIYVPEGTYEVSVYETTTVENPLFKQKLKVGSSKISTLALTGYYEDLKLLLIDEAKEGCDEDVSKLRVIHLSPNLPELNIIMNGELIFKELDFREVTAYTCLPSYEIYKMDIELAENDRLLRSNRIAVNVDRVYSLYILGNFASFQVFQSRDGSAFVTTVVR